MPFLARLLSLSLVEGDLGWGLGRWVCCLGSGFEVWSLGYWAWGLGLKVWGSEVGVLKLEMYV